MLRLALLADRLPMAAWSHGPLALAIASGLAARGHAVDVFCDSVESAGDLDAAGVNVHARVGYDHRARAAVGALARWAQQEMPRTRAQATLALGRLPLGDVWLPLVASPRAHRDRLWRRLGPRGGPLCWGAVLHDLKHWPADVLDARSLRLATRTCDPARVLCWGPEAASEARHALPAWKDRVRAVPLPSLHGRPPAAQVATLRAQMRRWLSIEADRLVVLASMPEGVDHHLLPVLRAIAHLHAGHRGRGPLLLITTNDGVAIRRAAVLTGAHAAVRVTGLTQRFDALLATADLAAVVAPRHGTAWTGSGPSRFISEAMSWARPVLAIRGASGSEHLRRAGQAEGGGRADGPGIIVPGARGVDWYVALQTAMDPTWRVSSGIAARGTADVHGFSLARVLDIVEEELARVAIARGARGMSGEGGASPAGAGGAAGGGRPVDAAAERGGAPSAGRAGRGGQGTVPGRR